ncbi:asparagine synthase (glutamine-hydrolyzing) [Rhodospirillum sp. A1_3_36]|uniref:asparagine synthase (glutamine-hydrolyzing) n=1 Tax=Rhodospirillum sp. A1_3_36 TaxID=3391666 RepID=UPI0039A5344E
MCGIVLTFGRRGQPVDPVVLERMAAVLRHRGPDDSSMVVEGAVGMAHTRLAVMDPEGGRQPLNDETGAITCIYNGQIYNHRALARGLIERGHRLTCRSDGAVIPHLYEEFGPDAFGMLAGMFAVILLDRRRRKIFVARDRLGIKPLTYHLDGQFLVCASEIKALLRHPQVPRTVDRQAVADFLCLGYPPEPATPFIGIRSLPGGEMLVCDLESGAVDVRPYWTPTFPSVQESCGLGPGMGETVEQFRALFDEVIADHLDADTKVCFSLSGGLDSSSIAATAARLRPASVDAFSLSFDDERFDETSHATAVAGHIGARLRRIPGGVPDLAHLQQAILSVEQPQIVTLDMANQNLSAAMRAEGYKVALAGDGADELMGGYDHFRLDAWRRAGRLQPHVLADLGYPTDFHAHYLATVEGERDRAENLFGLFPPWYPIWRMNQRLSTPLLAEPAADTLGPGGAVAHIADSLRTSMAAADPLNRALLLEMKTRLPSWVLWKSDRNAMANGIEVRVPFLDNRIIDFLAMLPPTMKLGLRKEKRVLRLAMAGRLPTAIRQRRKFAFNTPLSWVLAAPNLGDWLSPEALSRTGVFDGEQVANLLGQARMRLARPDFTGAMMAQTLTGVLTMQMLLLDDWT